MGSRIIDRAVKGLLVCMALILAFYIGAIVGPTSGKAQTAAIISADVDTTFSPTVESRVVESTTVRFVEKPVKVIEYIEEVKRIPVEIRNFSSLAELKQWLVEVEMTISVLYFQSSNDTVDCDDYAITLQQMALADGYLMSLEVTETNEYNALFKNSRLPPGSFHAMNLVVIEGDVYYIEPQTGEVVFAVHLD